MAKTIDPKLQVTPEEVRDMIERGEDFDLVDIRNHNTYRRSHLFGALPMPFGGTAPDDYLRHFPDKNRPLVVYCLRGEASSVVVSSLDDMGYTDVRYMVGGHWKWRFIKGNKPEVKHSSKPRGE